VKSMKTRIAAGATIVALGGLTGLALSAGQHKASPPVATKPLIRTKVIRRTIHVTKHAKPKHPVGASPGVASSSGGGSGSSVSATTGSSSVGSSSAYEAPVTTSTSGASATSGSSSEPVVTATSGGGGSSAPVTTATSGGGGGGGEGEHESEGADD